MDRSCYMFTFNTDHHNLRQFLQDFAAELKTELKGDFLQLPDWFGKGYLKIIILDKDIHALIVDFTLNTDFHLTRQVSDKPFYILRIHESHGRRKENGKQKLNGEPAAETITRGLAILYNNFNEVSLLTEKGTHIRGVSVSFPPEWLTEYLHVEDSHKLFQQYLALQSERQHQEPLNFEYRTILNEIFEFQGHTLSKIIEINRVRLLIEKFFFRTCNIMKRKELAVPINQSDIDKLYTAESLLISADLNKPLTITQLSKIVGMSPSNLKSKFKQLFQTSIYQYYQKHRLHKAMDMLATGKYSIKEVGTDLGFSNLSNFSIAFKKEFGMLPSEVLKKDGRKKESAG